LLELLHERGGKLRGRKIHERGGESKREEKNLLSFGVKMMRLKAY